MDNENLSVETTEVAEPLEVVSEETQEVAEPVETEAPARTEADARFAQMRREAEQYRQEAEQARLASQKAIDALGNFFEGNNDEEVIAEALAQARGVTKEEILAEQQRIEQEQRLTSENETLKNELLQIKVEQLMDKGLKEVQSLDPKIKSLDDLPPVFADYIKAGLDTKQAYFAAKALKDSETVVPPKTIGEVTQQPAEKDFYTSEEVDNMTPAQVKANYEKIRSSMAKW